MSEFRAGSSLPPSLAEVSPGDHVRIERILFDLVRSLCVDLGLSEGTQLQVQGRSDGEVVVRDGSGESMHLPSHYAHFVRVTHEDG